jgi:hypothetical protein
LIKELAESLTIASGLEVKLRSLKDNFELVKELKDEVQGLTELNRYNCDTLAEFVRCLKIYESQIIKSGSGSEVEKENKVFRIHGIAPPEPECPEIIYLPPITTTPPPIIPPEVTTTTTLSPCTPLIFDTQAPDKWYFLHTATNKEFKGTNGGANGSKADITIGNPNSSEVTLKCTVTLTTQADDDAFFQLTFNGTIVQASSVSGESQKAIKASVFQKYVMLPGGGNIRTTQDYVAIFDLLVPANSTAAINLFGALSNDNPDLDKFYVKSFKVDAINSDKQVCNKEELSKTKTAPDNGKSNRFKVKG